MNSITLNNNIKMPQIGFGVFQITNLKQCKDAVLNALDTGYRLLDTASIYANEEAVGEAIRESKIKREELFITTKVWINEQGYENTKQAFARSINKLGIEYLDLYLIHMPFGDYYGSWKAMEELYQKGKIRAIGVCNFDCARLMDLCFNAKIKPAINQIETHPFCQQNNLAAIMQEYKIQHEAWAPFAEGINNIFENPTLTKIAKKYNKTTAQIILRWNIQRGIIVIPKSIHKERIEENFNIWDFELEQDDMQEITSLDTQQSYLLDTFKPSEVKRLYSI
ncbi:MAG: aldo/keto reductase [Candidatus Gastranaerophilaceae bacterium]